MSAVAVLCPCVHFVAAPAAMLLLRFRSKRRLILLAGRLLVVVVPGLIALCRRMMHATYSMIPDMRMLHVVHTCSS